MKKLRLPILKWENSGVQESSFHYFPARLFRCRLDISTDRELFAWVSWGRVQGLGGGRGGGRNHILVPHHSSLYALIGLSVQSKTLRLPRKTKAKGLSLLLLCLDLVERGLQAMLSGQDKKVAWILSLKIPRSAQSPGSSYVPHHFHDCKGKKGRKQQNKKPTKTISPKVSVCFPTFSGTVLSYPFASIRFC